MTVTGFKAPCKSVAGLRSQRLAEFPMQKHLNARTDPFLTRANAVEFPIRSATKMS